MRDLISPHKHEHWAADYPIDDSDIFGSRHLYRLADYSANLRSMRIYLYAPVQASNGFEDIPARILPFRYLLRRG